MKTILIEKKGRKIDVYKSKKFIGTISTYNGWISFSNMKECDILREVAMKNLWFLLHKKVKNGISELESWKKQIEEFDNGTALKNLIDDYDDFDEDEEDPMSMSMFKSEEEKNIALNSINNI